MIPPPESSIKKEQDKNDAAALLPGDAISEVNTETLPNTVAQTTQLSHSDVEKMKRQYDEADLDDTHAYRILAFNAITALSVVLRHGRRKRS